MMDNNQALEWTEDGIDIPPAGVVREGAPAGGTNISYDLEERTTRFAESIIDFLKRVPLGPRTDRLVDQLTGCATSIGANYGEADDALSRKDFIKIIGVCRKESRETKFFLRLLARACPELAPSARALWQEACQLHLIFSRIRRTAQNNLSTK